MTRRAPLQFNAVPCTHCGALVALLPPGALVYDTRLQCVHCGVVVKIVKPLDKPAIGVYTKPQAPA